MRTPPALVLAALVILFNSTPVSAQLGPLESGNRLLPACRNAVRYFDQASRSELSTFGVTEASICIAYVTGFVHGSEQATATAALAVYGREHAQLLMPQYFRRLAAYCLPEQVSSSQIVRVVVAYLERRPEDLHKDTELLVVLALADAFPCR
jgi:hypothetical protein